MRPNRTLVIQVAFNFTLLLLFLLLASAKVVCGSLKSDTLPGMEANSRHAALWQQIYDRLPPVWKTRKSILVQEVTDAVLNDPQGQEDLDFQNRDHHSAESLEGDYTEPEEETRQPSRIRVLDSLDDEESGLTFAHEYGHFIWNEKLTPPQQRAYERVWRRQKQAGRLITDYAGEEPEEGFAEAFSYFLQQPDELQRRDNRSWRYLRSLSRQQADMQ
jgi:hypothetical protein